MSDYLDYFFGPLPKDYCLIFYGLSVLMGISFVIVLVYMLIELVYGAKGKSLMGVYIALLINYFVYYFMFRLLNTMCVQSYA